MILPCTINGQPATIEISETSLNRGALKPTEAAVYLGVCEKTVEKLAALGKLKKTSYGTYPISNLNTHLQREIERGAK